jgi:hypothetical protein
MARSQTCGWPFGWRGGGVPLRDILIILEPEADRQVANTLAELIVGGSLASTEITDEARKHQDATADRDSSEAV